MKTKKDNSEITQLIKSWDRKRKKKYTRKEMKGKKRKQVNVCALRSR